MGTCGTEKVGFCIGCPGREGFCIGYPIDTCYGAIKEGFGMTYIGAYNGYSWTGFSASYRFGICICYKGGFTIDVLLSCMELSIELLTLFCACWLRAAQISPYSISSCLCLSKFLKFPEFNFSRIYFYTTTNLSRIGFVLIPWELCSSFIVILVDSRSFSKAESLRPDALEDFDLRLVFIAKLAN